MYYTQCASEQYAYHVYADMPAVEDQFVTEPIIAVEAAYRQLNEEELHTLFEQAISDRVVTVSKRLKCISGSLNDCQPGSSQTSQRKRQAPMKMARLNWLPDSQKKTGSIAPNNLWQRFFIVAGLAIMLLLMGFDLMGVLILHMR